MDGDAAFVNWVIVMRRIVLAGAAASMSIIVSVPAFADTALGVACRAYAASVADKYMAERVVRVEGNGQQRQGFITVHSYGRKYLVPRHTAGDGNLFPETIGTATREWGLIYTEERDRCLNDRLLGDFPLAR